MPVNSKPDPKVGAILLDGMTVVKAAPEWNAAPPASYLRFYLVRRNALEYRGHVLVDMWTMITQDRIRWLSQMCSQCDLIRASARRHEQASFFASQLSYMCFQRTKGKMLDPHMAPNERHSRSRMIEINVISKGSKSSVGIHLLCRDCS